ncbi:MAG: lipid-A-disaccharide synthase [Synergistaceae bacterium]|nr:lipid-A-disaccharide synthase [Synergistaceae bacterium]
MKKIFVSCGEVSGDLYAGDFIREVLKLDPSIKISGMLGPEGQRAGGVAQWSYEELKLMGILEIVPALPKIFALKNSITDEIMKSKPDAVVLIDSPDFHLMLAKSLRRKNFAGKIICLIPPTVWAWRAGRVKNLRRDFDLCLPLFYFEHKFLIEHGVNSKWKAHPLVHDLEGVKVSDTFRKRFGDERLIALMPGSRRYDIDFHLDILLDAAKLLRSKNFLPVFSIAPGLSQSLADELRCRVKVSGFEFWEGEGRELMLASEAVAGVSGTVAVEAMLLGRFMVVIYNMKKINYAILKKLVHVKKISVPNLLTGREVYPELLCQDATPERIIYELENYLSDGSRREDIDTALREGKALMGDCNAAEFWADSVLALNR